MTNTCRANPNTSADSPSDGESGEVFGVALHLFVTKFLGVMGDESTLAHLCRHMRSGDKCIQKVCAFCVLSSKG